MFLTDNFGRRNLVFYCTIICVGRLLVVGILAFVSKTQPIMNFLIFVACVWAFVNNVTNWKFELRLGWRGRLAEAAGSSCWHCIGNLKSSSDLFLILRSLLLLSPGQYLRFI
ncbi:hypothetical protein jhhlp_005132 [Lomentospora prolificans]|uniref:Uncharacterized protein n=1 Tax=Lomentospora prolificans TaxID=41688 RepID=A0A2N3N7J7_9PEZI|nr:hypothetical protein jhhlp_005132 [Lomentospora prolificans]